jgi:Leucine-rich repeat (LRR) protein
LSGIEITDQELEILLHRMPRIDYLVLDGMAITAQSGPHLGQLKNPKQLHLPNCTRVDNGILEHLAKFKDLNYLNLRGTSLSDEGLPLLYRMTGMGTLVLHNTRVTETGVKQLAAALPRCRIEWDGGVVGPKPDFSDPDRQAAQWIVRLGHQFDYVDSQGKIISVERFDQIPKSPFKIGSVVLRGNQPPTPDEFATLKDLEQLGTLGIRTNIDRRALTLLPTFPHLGTIILHGPLGDHTGVHFTDRDLEILRQLPKLAALTLQATAITNQAGPQLAQLENLDYLHLQDTKVDDAILEHVAKLKALDFLNISMTSISDEGLPLLQGLTDLRIVLLGSTKVTDAGVLALPEWPELWNLQLFGLPLTDAVVPSLVKRKQLTYLNLQGTKITGDGIAKLHEALPKCKIDWDGGVIEPKRDSADPDRQAAEWLVRLGHRFDYVDSQGRVFTVERVDQIPEFKFKIETLILQSAELPTREQLVALRDLEQLDTVQIHTDVSSRILGHLPTYRHLTFVELRGPFDDGPGVQIADKNLEVLLPRLPRLEVLGLPGTAITNQAGPHLAQLKALHSLSLQSTKVDDGILEDVVKLNALQTLNLSNTSVSDEGLPLLQQLSGLRTVYLSETKVTEAGVKKFAAALPKCRIEWDGGVIGPETDSTDPDREVARSLFSIGASAITLKQDNHRYTEYQKLPRTAFTISQIDLQDVAITDAQMAMIDGLGDLDALYLSRNKQTQLPISDEGLKQLGTLPKLRVLSLLHHNITDDGLRELARFPNLGYLDLSSTKVTDEGLRHLAALPKLTELTLNRTQVTGTGLAHLAGCRDMSLVWLRWSPVTDEGLLSFPDWPKLKGLDLESSQITDRGIRVLGRFPNLRKLTVHSVTQVTPEGWKVLSSLERLENLSLRATSIDDAALESLTKLATLQSLDLTTRKVSKTGIELLQKALPQCKITWRDEVVEAKMEPQ